MARRAAHWAIFSPGVHLLIVWLFVGVASYSLLQWSRELAERACCSV